jgi:hypothetical protein
MDDVTINPSSTSLDEGATPQFVLWIGEQFIGYFSSEVSAYRKAESIKGIL